MNWFRFYSEAIDDPKVQSLRPELFKAWVNILCLANAQFHRGTIPPLSAVAFGLRITPDEAEAFVEELIDLGLIDEGDDGTRWVHNWDKWQYSQEPAARRQRKHRDKVRSKVETEATGPGCDVVTPDVTPDVTPPAHASATAPAAPPRAPAPAPAHGQSRAEQSREINLPLAGMPAAGAPAGPHAREGGPGSPNECIEIARRLFGEAEAARVEAKADDIGRVLGGRWDCFAAALREAHRRQGEPNRKDIRNLVGYCLRIAPDFAAGVPPPSPVAARAAPALTREEQARRDAELMERIDVSKLY